MAVKVDQALHDAIISYQLDLRRLEAGTRVDVLRLLTQMQRELVSVIANSGKLTEYTKVQKQTLLRQVRTVITDYYSKAEGHLADVANELAVTQAQHMGVMLETTLAVAATGAALPTDTALSRLAGGSLIEGGPVADWWGRLATDTTFKVGNAIRQGIAQGETNSQIIARVTGTPGAVGAMDAARHNVAALVQTTTQTVANDARMAVFDSNQDIIEGLVWFSAMDGHVCPRCIALSGRKWRNTEDHEPIGHSVPFRNPPIHWNDRCVLLPVTKSFKDLGVDIPEVPDGQRASRYGPVGSRAVFGDFLSRRSTQQQDEQLGAGRAQLWRDGKITLNQLIDGKGRELTLAQLKAKYDK